MKEELSTEMLLNLRPCNLSVNYSYILLLLLLLYKHILVWTEFKTAFIQIVLTHSNRA